MADKNNAGDYNTGDRDVGGWTRSSYGGAQRGCGMIPRITDNDLGLITATLDGKEIRGWPYANNAERRDKIRAAREFCEGWYQRGRVDETGRLRACLDERVAMETRMHAAYQHEIEQLNGRLARIGRAVIDLMAMTAGDMTRDDCVEDE